MITEVDTGRTWPDIWAALEDDPAVAANLRMRSNLMAAIRARVMAWNVPQVQAAKQLAITQPRLNSLLRGNINRFSVDSLVNIAVKAGLSVNIDLKDAA